VSERPDPWVRKGLKAPLGSKGRRERTVLTGHRGLRVSKVSKDRRGRTELMENRGLRVSKEDRVHQEIKESRGRTLTRLTSLNWSQKSRPMRR
tara:strand:+ start:182 stop:460 length:279 start_codon:yes stop_codon:yes gene_type:complete